MGNMAEEDKCVIGKLSRLFIIVVSSILVLVLYLRWRCGDESICAEPTSRLLFVMLCTAKLVRAGSYKPSVALALKKWKCLVAKRIFLTFAVACMGRGCLFPM